MDISRLDVGRIDLIAVLTEHSIEATRIGTLIAPPHLTEFSLQTPSGGLPEETAARRPRLGDVHG